jgi:hypothetical protein
MYAPCLLIVIFIFLSSLSHALALFIARCMPKDKTLNFQETDAGDVLQK